MAAFVYLASVVSAMVTGTAPIEVGPPIDERKVPGASRLTLRHSHGEAIKAFRDFDLTRKA
jgi:hypothetical protein